MTCCTLQGGPVKRAQILSERRNQILLAAIELIADQGYASLSMRALAREVGMKLGALQYHFKTADQLMTAIVGHIASAYQTHFDVLDKISTPPFEPYPPYRLHPG